MKSQCKYDDQSDVAENKKGDVFFHFLVRKLYFRTFLNPREIPFRANSIFCEAGRGRRGCHPSGVSCMCGPFPVVSLADSLDHRLLGWQASGLLKADRRPEVDGYLRSPLARCLKPKGTAPNISVFGISDTRFDTVGVGLGQLAKIQTNCPNAR